jgi:hypothetical protein
VIWDRVTLHVAGLPEELRRRGQLLLASLAVRYSRDGRLASVLAAPEFDPLLYLPKWGLADINSSGDCDPIEFCIAVAAAFEFAAADLLYTDKGKEATSLAQILDDAANSLFMSTVGEDELFWDIKNSTWQRYKAILASSDVDLNQLVDADRAVAVHAIVGASIDVLAESGGRIASAVAHVGAALAIERDLASLRADLEAGSTTIATIAARAAAGSIDDPELIYLVAASSHVHRHLIDLALQQARRALEGVSGLQRLSAHVTTLIDRLSTSKSALALESSMTAHPLPRGSRTAGMGKRMAAAIEHARRFLLADPTFQEAREVHRHVRLGPHEMTSIFPMAFPLEALARCGEGVSDLLDSWLEEMASHSFSYYDDPRLGSLDADTVGAVLRLWKYRSHIAHPSSTIDALVSRASAALEDRDRIPVWLERPIESHIRLTGGMCAAVEANFLVGLIEAAADVFPKIGARPLARLLSDFAARGTSDAIDYVDDYLLVPISRLLVHQNGGGDNDAGDAARARLSSEIERRAEASSPQTIAFLIMAASNHPELETQAWSWIDILIRSQRYDGGWDAEPLFWVNGFGGAPEWFRSRTVTTSFCYEALSVAVSTR